MNILAVANEQNLWGNEEDSLQGASSEILASSHLIDTSMFYSEGKPSLSELFNQSIFANQRGTNLQSLLSVLDSSEYF